MQRAVDGPAGHLPQAAQRRGAHNFRQVPQVLGAVSVVSLVGFWLERNALVWPSLQPHDDGAWLGVIQIGIALGFLGAFVLVYLVFSRIFPTLPLPVRD